MGTLFNIVIWLSQFFIAFLVLLFKPIWWTATPFLKANRVVNTFIRKYIPLFGNFLALFTQCVWAPIFITFWAGVYGIAIGYGADFVHQTANVLYLILDDVAGQAPERFIWVFNIIGMPLRLIMDVTLYAMFYIGGLSEIFMDDGFADTVVTLTTVCWFWGWAKLVLVWVGHEWGFLGNKENRGQVFLFE
ncbi:hypothetical protein [Endozoicomonas sp.]|uniref:hypothetical protein n=1 Tax=Endozoicomonas sp. TaxID=1892382 RepID=UPI00383B63F9